jgi:hypothetical protein
VPILCGAQARRTGAAARKGGRKLTAMTVTGAGA